MNKLLNLLENAINNNELKKFLMGEGVYNIPSRDGSFSDLGIALYMGIYEYYKQKPEKQINNLFEQELINMLNGSDFETVVAFEYVWRQITSEGKNIAPFKISGNCLLTAKNSISKKMPSLKTFKQYSEFGGNLKNGAYDYIKNIDNYVYHEYGQKIL